MNESLNIWKFIAGLGIFLYGMSQMEASLKEMAGRRFKLFLRKTTSNRFMAILYGSLATALLQSSSIILLLTIAFAGAGIISLTNSLGIILGANLGTTMTGWLVSAVGLKANVENFIYPILSLGCVGTLFMGRRLYVSHFFVFFFALGLLLLGLSYMKDSMAQVASLIDLSEIHRYGGTGFFILGFVLTAIIQSSSAMIAITLGALHTNIIELLPAAYIVVGADLGTTITTLLASLRGTEVKKRIGLAHFLFNLVNALVTLAFLKKILAFVQHAYGINDPLYSLTAFHSSFNLIGILIFFPFLNQFEKILSLFFRNNRSYECSYIHKVSPEVPEVALEVTAKELISFGKLVLNFNSSVLGAQTNVAKKEIPIFSFFRSLLTEEDVSQHYERLKKIEGELLRYLANLQRQKLTEEESELLKRYILGLRNGVQSAKAMKDIRHNMKEFGASITESVEIFVTQIHQAYLPLQQKIGEHLISENKTQISELHSEADSAYHRINEWIYRQAKMTPSLDQKVATFLNVNREIQNANILLIDALELIDTKS